MPPIVSLRRQFVNYWLGLGAFFTFSQGLGFICYHFFLSGWTNSAILLLLLVEAGILLEITIFVFLPILPRLLAAIRYARLRNDAISEQPQRTTEKTMESVFGANGLPTSTEVQIRPRNIAFFFLFVNLVLSIFLLLVAIISTSFEANTHSQDSGANRILLLFIFGFQLFLNLMISPFYVFSFQFSRYRVQADERGIEVWRRWGHWYISWHDVRLILQIPPKLFFNLQQGGFLRPVSAGTFDIIGMEYLKSDMLDTCYEIASAERRILIFIPQEGGFTKRTTFLLKPIYDDPATYRERMHAIIALAVARTGVSVRTERASDVD